MLSLLELSLDHNKYIACLLYMRILTWRQWILKKILMQVTHNGNNEILFPLKDMKPFE